MTYPRERGPRMVYFIKPIGMDGPVKIGCSQHPAGRKSSLATWAPFPLEIVAQIEGDQALEMRFHQMFLEHHRGHEWFDITPELTALIASIVAGEFDQASVPPIVKGFRNNMRGERDSSYLTPGWRYKRGFAMRAMHIRRRMSKAQDDWFWKATWALERLGDEELLERKAEAEALIEQGRKVAAGSRVAA